MQPNETTQTLRRHGGFSDFPTDTGTDNSVFDFKRYPLTTDEKSVIWILGGLLSVLWLLIF